MKTLNLSSKFLSLLSLFLLSSCTEKNEVTMVTLLQEMGDRKIVAEFPQPVFKLKQESSYNRVSVTPDKAKTWFANADFNSAPADHKFVRIDTINGCKEWVLMDHNSPGAIVRTWMPFPNAKSPNTDNIIKVYIDGDTVPAIQGNMLEVFNGDGIIPYPFAHKSLRSAVSFFPITYSKSCKVTTTKRPSFYQITYREYPQNVKVKSFTVEDFKANKELITETGNILLGNTNDNPFSEDNAVESKDKLLPAGEKESISLERPLSSLNTLQLKLKEEAFSDSMLTRNVFIRISFDGKETVNSPIGDFFGCGIGLNPYRDFYREVTEDYRFISRWVMPFKEKVEVSVENRTDSDIDVQLKIFCSDYNWTDNTMYFHSAYRHEDEVPTRPYSDWNYITLKGKGVYVGDALTVYNPVKKWWGEGDEKIWVDNESFPSLFGTGTEDYYGYSWGGISTDFYEHPFHGQPRCNVYNKLSRKLNQDERNTQGYSTETRVRSLDGIVFNESLKLDMEVWSWTDCVMKYAVGTSWYMLHD